MLEIKQITERFTATRRRTEELCDPLETEDFVVQPVEYVSPPKWHLGHTSWFFEEFVLKPQMSDYRLFDPQFNYVFNSYYESVGKRVIRTDRGNLSRPTVSEILKYRQHVTAALTEFLKTEVSREVLEIIELGIHHEKQHQELLLTDIKFILGNNPLLPIYDKSFDENPDRASKAKYLNIPAGVYEVGHNSPDEFHYDNEEGRHKVYLEDYSISTELVTNAEYLAFIEDKGYSDPLLWHAEGWDWINQNNISGPMYWHRVDSDWKQFTLQGLKPILADAPVSHISYYEAFAYAQWKQRRLPTEFEWEVAASRLNYGSRWEWTESAYLPYPGFNKAPGALGEYNGKFMVNQKVLRGGSVATSENHFRLTYRNFFHPHLRWQFTGFRLVN